MSKEIWYYARSDGSAVGPLSRRQLLQLRREQTVSKYTLVWDNQTYDWRPFHKTPAAVLLLNEEEGTAPLPTAAPPAPPIPKSVRSSPAAASKAERRAAVARSRELRAAQSKAKSKANSKTTSSAPTAFFPGTSPRTDSEPAPAPKESDAAATKRVGWAARRWVARLFDLGVSAPLAVLIVMLLLHAMDLSVQIPLHVWIAEPVAFLAACLVLWVPFEALLLSLFGTTPGKALWGVRVASSRGGNLGPFSALHRSVGVLLRGLLLGLPPLTLLSQGWALVSYINSGTTSWDSASGAELQFSPLTGNRMVIALLISFASAALYLDGTTLSQLLPLYAELRSNLY